MKCIRGIEKQETNEPINTLQLVVVQFHWQLPCRFASHAHTADLNYVPFALPRHSLGSCCKDCLCCCVQAMFLSQTERFVGRCRKDRSFERPQEFGEGRGVGPAGSMAPENTTQYLMDKAFSDLLSDCGTETFSSANLHDAIDFSRAHSCQPCNLQTRCPSCRRSLRIQLCPLEAVRFAQSTVVQWFLCSTNVYKNIAGVSCTCEHVSWNSERDFTHVRSPVAALHSWGQRSEVGFTHMAVNEGLCLAPGRSSL
ncbi:hypothetical protein SKAU_G00041780 [Synaphobranchus kaupii]|uniref:Uncharacterized protein n=1 Tax=Synaphobranchus kaupii TaxID=118154 RepID=A0A9Q1G171_SYNKA|nr:hypothetical protein SKAU_G00041780 [Synaphobranchus kaupii]